MTKYPFWPILNDMVKYQPKSLDAVFSALADPTRRAIVEQLSGQELSVSELAEPFSMSLPAISRHLRVLEHAGLLVQERDGRIRHCHLDPEPMQAAAAWLAKYTQFWQDQFDSLSAFLQTAQTQPQEKEHEPTDDSS